MARKYIAQKKREATLQTLWNQYVRGTKETDRPLYGNFELKVTDDHSLPFSRIEPHQYDGLISMEKNGLVWKLSDEDGRQKPCDSLSIPPLPSYLVIKFPGPFTYMIPMEEVVKIREEGIISIKEERAREVAERIVELST